MILRELFYFNRDTTDFEDDRRYDERSDDSPVEITDTRKTRLTLKQINKIRKATDMHNEDKAEELQFIRQMYGIAANAEEGM